MTTQFPRAHQFNKLDAKQQHDFAKEMVKLWTQAKADIQADAVKAGLAYYYTQESSYKAKPAYVQPRQMFDWK